MKHVSRMSRVTAWHCAGRLKKNVRPLYIYRSAVCSLGDKDPEECWLLNYSSSFSFRQQQPALKTAYNSYVIYEAILLHEASLITLLYQRKCLAHVRRGIILFSHIKNCLVEEFESSSPLTQKTYLTNIKPNLILEFKSNRYPKGFQFKIQHALFFHHSRQVPSPSQFTEFNHTEDSSNNIIKTLN
jgi:hypothetical protein